MGCAHHLIVICTREQTYMHLSDHYKTPTGSLVDALKQYFAYRFAAATLYQVFWTVPPISRLHHCS
jgi:hypothetical protein